MDYLPDSTEIRISALPVVALTHVSAPPASVYLDWTADLLTKEHMQTNFTDGGFVSSKGSWCKKASCLSQMFYRSHGLQRPQQHFSFLGILWCRLQYKRFRWNPVSECRCDWHKGLGSLCGFLLMHKLDSGRLSKHASDNIEGFLHSRSGEGWAW